MARMSSYAAMRGFRANADALFERTALPSPSAATAAVSAPANDAVTGGKDYTSITELMSDFVRDRRAKAEQETGDADIDFNAMDDDKLFKNLFDFLASGQINATINGVLIEAAEQMKDLIATLLNMDDDGSDDPNASQEAKNRKRTEQLRAHAKEQQERQQEELEEYRAKWDAEMHTVGGHQFSGALLHAMHIFLQDPTNMEAFEQELSTTHGPEEGKRRAQELKEYLKLKEKERNKEELSEQEKRRLRELASKPSIAEDLKTLEKTRNLGYSAHLNGGMIDRASADQITSVQKGMAFFVEDENKLLDEKQEKLREWMTLKLMQHNGVPLRLNETKRLEELQSDNSFIKDLKVLEARNNTPSTLQRAGNVTQLPSQLTENVSLLGDTVEANNSLNTAIARNQSNPKTPVSWSSQDAIIQTDRALTSEYNSAANGAQPVPKINEPTRKVQAALVMEVSGSGLG